LKDGTEAVFEEPDDLGADNVTTRGDLEKYRADLYTFRRGKKNYIDDKAKVFGLIMGRCHPTMKSKVESDQDFHDLEKNDDVVGLLKKLKKLAYSTGNNQYSYWVIHEQMRKFMTLWQDPRESLPNFGVRFIAQQEVMEEEWVGKLSP
jgi:hypothetical protein